MMINDLIRHLRSMKKSNPEVGSFKVYLDGCDCSGEWSGEIRIGSKSATLERGHDD